VIRLRSLTFNIIFFTWTFLFSVSVILLGFLPRKLLQRTIARWMGTVMTVLRWTTGIRYEVRGWENFPTGPAIIASKHQSAWDTGIFYILCHDPAYVLKRELIWIPFYGWVLKRVKMIAVDRSAHASALKRLIRQAGAALKAGRQVVIFPEGTRRAVGAPPDYQPGVAALYRAFDVPVVPVAVNSGLYWPRRSFLKKRGTILVEFLPAIPKGLDRKEFMAELEGRIEEGTRRLVAEGERSLKA
jgi:1-acyl-sn-glycerol-3-phosphate acyltransferase